MHWTVLVVTKDDPRDAKGGGRDNRVIEAALAPFNEQTSDEAFCERRDITDDANQEYKLHLSRASANEPKQSFTDFLIEYFGTEVKYEPTTGLVTNLYVINPQWDWWQIGGRWQGMMRAKNPELAGTGETSALADDKTVHGCDICQKGNVDWKAMETQIREQAEITWRDVRTLIADAPTFLLEWGIVVDLPGSDPRSVAFYGKPAMQHIRQKMGMFSMQPVIDILKHDLPAYQDLRAEREAFRSYAFLDADGQWHETDGDNRHRFDALLAEVPDDYWLTVVDCHS